MLRREIDGFVADRMLEALWREALWLVHDDVATVARDRRRDPLRPRPALGASWAPFLTYRIAGGEAGMRHFMAQFGPALQWPWTQLTDVPELTDELLDRIVAQSDEQAAGRSVRELERAARRLPGGDPAGPAQRGLRRGQVLERYERDLSTAPRRRRRRDDERGRCACTATACRPEWVDYNGHAHESRYLQLLGDATDALLRHVGVDAAYLEAGGSYFTVETHLAVLHEARAGDDAAGRDAAARRTTHKRLLLFHRLLARPTERELATGEHLLLHVDTEPQASCRAGRRSRCSQRIGALAGAPRRPAPPRGAPAAPSRWRAPEAAACRRRRTSCW